MNEEKIQDPLTFSQQATGDPTDFTSTEQQGTEEPQAEPQQTSATGNTYATSVSMLHMVMTETLGLAMYNAVSAQQNAQIVNSALVSSVCARILSVNRRNTRVNKSPIAATRNNVRDSNGKNAATEKKGTSARNRAKK